MALLHPARWTCLFLTVWFALLGWGTSRMTAAPPVVRSTSYDGSYTSIVHYAVEPWMNTNTVALTVEAWVYCRDLLGFQALVARHYTTNLWFGLNGSRLRFYRSGGMLADSDATLVANRWTHVAVTYDGTTARFYVNGVAGGVKTLGHAGNNCTNTLSLGGQWDRLNAGDTNTAGYAFNGWLDEVRIWTVARTGAAIAGGMDQEVRVGSGLAGVFAEGGRWNEVTEITGETVVPLPDRESGFGVLPRMLCIPYTTKALVADGTIDLLNEYRGAETLVLRSRLSTNAPDAVAYLMVSRNSTNHHLFVGVPSLPQAGGTNLPLVQVQADVNPTDGTALALGDWECRLAQDGLQGGRIYGVSPPFFPDPTWLSWGQGVSNWQAATVSPFEFQQNYEFRIHGRHLNNFTNDIGLLVRYYDYDALGDQLAGPRDAVTNQPATYARASWCGLAAAPTVNLTIRCSVTNITTGVGVSNLAVAVYSGESELAGQLLRTFRTGPAGTLSAWIEAPRGAPVVVSYAPPANVNQLPPVLPYFGPEFGVSALGSASIRIGYPDTCSTCGHYVFEGLQFRFYERGPVGVTGLNPTELPALVTVRTNPVKMVGGGSFTVLGSNLTAGVQVYLRGPGCSLSPPSLCTSDWTPAPVAAVAPDGSSLVATVPPGLTWYESGARAFQVVVENPGYLATGGNRWNYGPSLNLIAPAWPLLNGFEFINRDDGPSVEEFEACYEYSIFTPLGFRDPYYGLWASLYLIWMDALKGSCYGFSGTSALMADGSLPRQAYDQAGADGVRGVRYPNGYLGVFPCVEGTNVYEGICPPKPGRWTGFDLFQPYRPVNLWSRITSLAGAQTSAEAIVGILSQLGTPVPFGARRGFASGNPVDVLNRLRSAPGQYTLCVQKRDFGDGHCITPYGIVENFGLDTDAVLPVANTNKSLIRIYDNNHPGQERFIEVDHYFNIFRYNSGHPRVGIYEGPGLFFTSLSTYRGPRHALDPFSLGRLGVDYLRTLLSGTAAVAWQDGSGGRAGWTMGGLTNTYGGALPYLPVGLLPEGAETAWDTTMLFLPGSNAPVSGTFASAGSNVLLYAAMGWGDIAYGFRAANTAATHVVDGIVTKPGEGLTALGLRAVSPVTGFSAMIASRDTNGRSRVLLLDAGAGTNQPDVQVEREGLGGVLVRNRGTAPLAFRVALAGAEPAGQVFDHAYGSVTQPGLSTLRLVYPLAPLASPGLRRELDTNNDGAPDQVEMLPATGQLRIGPEAGLLALRWRQAGFGAVLETSPRVAPAAWSAVNATVGTEGGDRVARVSPATNSALYRLRYQSTNCLSLAGLASGSRPNPWATNGFQFEAATAAGTLAPQNTLTNRAGYTGLQVASVLRVTPPEGSGAVTLQVFNPDEPVIVEAVGPLGAILSRQTFPASPTAPQAVSVRGYRGSLQFIRVTVAAKPALVTSACAEMAAP